MSVATTVDCRLQIGSRDGICDLCEREYMLGIWDMDVMLDTGTSTWYL